MPSEWRHLWSGPGAQESSKCPESPPAVRPGRDRGRTTSQRKPSWEPKRANALRLRTSLIRARRPRVKEMKYPEPWASLRLRYVPGEKGVERPPRGNPRESRNGQTPSDWGHLWSGPGVQESKKWKTQSPGHHSACGTSREKRGSNDLPGGNPPHQSFMQVDPHSACGPSREMSVTSDHTGETSGPPAVRPGRTWLLATLLWLILFLVLPYREDFHESHWRNPSKGRGQTSEPQLCTASRESVSSIQYSRNETPNFHNNTPPLGANPLRTIGGSPPKDGDKPENPNSARYLVIETRRNPSKQRSKHSDRPSASHYSQVESLGWCFTCCNMLQLASELRDGGGRPSPGRVYHWGLLWPCFKRERSSTIRAAPMRIVAQLYL